ncbi:MULTISPECIES: DUF736 domain-containing protein [Methylobacterium]|jgi:uncharacterized protein (DUF736 family)|uniref:DUF736 domain-containing protein n=1 Tax=Methylobacterium radiotolerans (strain ATCC 27329 / DSM 1819 / JCM 2831 / NBRC 15690 / NCIMB 10815 / 0-1) TaxID=426355 RepID=B1M912_METRJ|nr:MULTISPECIES: DUF736 domain-containing protein [Methylobacterium]GAN47328.1 hypothetical protein ME121_1335 [Methylobacterium sp. ME121]ACB27987.1 protein of unknown function DUF736 [Methylobacterium radiotolerans JCM 2831]KTS06282.1 hypothetical protein SB3_20165 [Methylobacterium radiotolerans]KTS48717.1 hypothetical protein SB2_09795 [Methylobacterium radiotolerans]MBN6819860.1 DUF736 domain-containing protein [Methylobacterium organophilum]
MATIGTFTRTQDGYVGEIVTLTVRARNVRLVPNTAMNENAPSHRIYARGAEIGAAWTKLSEEQREYLSLKLDDPSFPAPIYAKLFDDEQGDTATLIWSRPNGRRD